MIQTSFMEQISIFFNLLKNSPYFLGLSIAFFITLGILLLANKFKNKKLTKILCILVYTGILGTLIYFYHQEILNLIDYLVEKIFLFLFFPNLAVYMLVLIVINVIIIKSTFTKDDNKGIRLLNIICFLIFNVIFFFIIQNIITNNINVYEQLSIYTNQELLVLIELSMQLFLIWILLLFVIKLIELLFNYTALRKSTNNYLNLEEEIEVRELEVARVDDIISSRIDELPYEEIIPREETPKYNIYNDYIDIVPIKKVKKTVEENLSNDEVLLKQENSDNIIKEEKKIINIESNLNNYENIFTNNFNSNMNSVFTNTPIQNISLEIEKLKNNQNDKNAIKLIYDQIKLYEKELTLKDYNTLIDMLVEIKK